MCPPLESQLTYAPSYVNTFDNNSMHNQDPVSKHKDHTGSSTFTGPGLPPIPARLVEKVQSGQFVELAELLPDHIGSLSGNPALDNESKTRSKQSKHQVSTILEWVQCFSLYWTVIALKDPARLPDLLGYQVRPEWNMKVMDGLATAVDSDKWQQFSHQLPGIK